MIIHSIISADDILLNSAAEICTEYKAVKGGIIEIEETCGSRHIRRLISTDPSMYLKKDYYPFTVIKE